MDLLEDILKLKKKGKKGKIDNDFEDMPKKDYEEDDIGPLDMLFKSRDEKVDHKVKQNKDTSRRINEEKGESSRNLDKIKALDDILKDGSVSIEKIEIKKKKNDEDDEAIDLPALVTGSH